MQPSELLILDGCLRGGWSSDGRTGGETEGLGSGLCVDGIGEWLVCCWDWGVGGVLMGLGSDWCVDGIGE